MNYAELVQAIQDYTETTEQIFVDNIPVFVQQAEERIYNTVQIPALRRNVVGNTTATNKYLACPNDFLSVYSLAAVDATGRYEYLLNKDVNFIRQAYPSPTSTGIPRYYALFGPRSGNSTELAFILGPTPDAVYTMELHYFYYPESIVTAGTSWLGDNYSPALLYGALREAYLFQKGEQDLIQNVEAKYNEAMAQLKRLGDGLERGDAYRDGQTKLQYNKL
jgi:hypothetical protein